MATGANINAEYIGSVNVNTGDSNELAVAPAGDARANPLECFKHSIKERTESLSNGGVTIGYSTLKEPDFEVCPALLDVDYYRGETAPLEVEYDPESNFSGNARKWVGQRVELNKIFVANKKQKFRHVSLLGGAGSGKTTLLRRYARLVQEGKIIPRTGKSNSWFRRNEMLVHFINVRELPAEGTFTPKTLLFDNMLKELGENSKIIGYDWAKRAHELMFVIDGLDQSSWVLEAEDRNIGYEEEATVACVISNLLRGELFPNALVLTSSRERTIRFFKDKLRADRTIALNGLDRSDIEMLAKALPKENVDVWNRLNVKCPNLLLMCMTPLFLIFTVIVFIEKKFCSDTLTGVMSHLIYCFCESNHTRSLNIPETIKKLKKLAYKGTMRRKVIFTEEDFAAVELRSIDAQDFVLFAPKKTFLLRKEKMNSRDYVMLFCHQSVQEALAAFQVCDMSVEEFEEYIDTKLHLPQFSVVRRMICGALLDEKTREESEGTITVSLLEEKQRLLKKSLTQAILSNSSRADKIELLYSLYECGSGANELIASHMRSIAVCRQPLTVIGASILASVSKRAQMLESLELWECQIDPDVLETIWNELRTSNVQIKKLDMHSNYGNAFTGQTLAKLCHHCKVQELDVNDCNLDDEKMTKFGEYFEGGDVKRMIISKNANLGDGSLKEIGKMVRFCGTEELNISNCGLTRRKLERFREGLENARIVSFGVSENKNMGANGIACVGDIVRECQIENLNLSECGLSSDELHSLASSLEGYKLEKLDISLQQPRMLEIAAQVSVLKLLQLVKHELNLTNWEMELGFHKILGGNHESVKKEIGPGGDTMGVDGCQIQFPPGSVARETAFLLSTNSSPVYWNRYIPISPMLICQPSVRFPVSVTLRIPVWCSPREENVTICILSQDDGDHASKIAATLQLEKGTKNGAIECKHFTRFRAFIERTLFGAVSYTIHVSLYLHSEGNVYMVFCPDENTAKKERETEMKDLGYVRAPIVFASLSIKEGDSIEATIDLENRKRYDFDHSGKRGFTMEESFADRLQEHLKFRLVTPPTVGDRVVLSYKLVLNKTTHVEDRCNVAWPDAVSSRGGPTTITGGCVVVGSGSISSNRQGGTDYVGMNEPLPREMRTVSPYSHHLTPGDVTSR